MRPDHSALHRGERDADPWTVLVRHQVERDAIIRPKAPPQSVNAMSEDQSLDLCKTIEILRMCTDTKSLLLAETFLAVAAVSVDDGQR